MSKIISGEMLQYLKGDAAALCTCWQLKLTDGTVMGFTDSDQDQLYNGTKFIAATGFTASAIETPVDLSDSNLEVEGLISSDGILDTDIEAGRYDFAECWIFKMVPGDADARKYGIVKIRRGWLGQMTIKEGQHVCEIRGLMSLLAQNFVEIYSLECQADFCDTRCKLNAADFTDNGKVTSGFGGNMSFGGTITISTPRPAGFYNFGNVTWLTGKNKGVVSEVKNWDGTTFALRLPTGYPIALGDTFSVIAGCDKSLTTCESFQNVINMRGFPYVPGLDTTIYPNASQAVPTSI